MGKADPFLAEAADDDAETGYDTDPLRDELGLLCCAGRPLTR
jgi:hypothetical protein